MEEVLVEQDDAVLEEEEGVEGELQGGVDKSHVQQPIQIIILCMCRDGRLNCVITLRYSLQITTCRIYVRYSAP